MTDADVTRLHAHEMAARLRTGEVSARELTRRTWNSPSARTGPSTHG